MGARWVRAAAVMGSVAVLAGCGASSTTPAGTYTPGAVTTSSTSSSTWLPEPSYPTSPAPVSAPPAAASAAAVRFVQLLGHTAGADRTKWTDALTPLCTKEFGDQLALGSPSEIPDQKVSGSAALVGSSALLVAAYFVPTSKGGFTVWVDYSQSPVLVTAAMPGRQSFEQAAS
ncbi:hypothetical protein ATK17_3921 [Branchiibius hedensis]|uniref:Lipoprotein LpqN n=1 Tax=Branchiibius hedensis TaxID=672460 RepID=A0A2Y9CAX7_9MICO|nr:hypothetical protein [Branchiibius hedensis]PWJ23030.1 hypothetical protein ATK17_3921 [Branchiibius hedensis]SSA59106.1 hypothetical protein SAMN04489750_3921 [Branchiibius hedensis]